MSGQRALRACAVTLICAVLVLLVGTGSAAAHAALLATEPGQGAVVTTMPATVSLTFSEPVVVALAGVQVFGPDGARVDDGHATHLGGAATVGVRVVSHQSPQGTYTVSWRVISADSHPVAGAFTFSIGHPSPSRASPDRAVTATQPLGSKTTGVVYAIVRAAAFGSFALLVGSVGFILFCWPEAITSPGTRRIMLAGWAGLLVTAIATLLLQGPYANGLSLDRVADPGIVSETLTSRLGTALTVRLVLLALAGGYVVLLCAWLGHLNRRGRAWFMVTGVVLAASLAATWAAADHAAVGFQPALALPIDVVHLLAMGGWLGGLVTLVVLLRPAAVPGTAAPTLPQRAVMRFSSVATGAIMLVIGTGSYQSWRQLGSWGAFGSTDYGRLLLVKLGTVGLMLGAASLSHRWVSRHRRVLMGVGAATRAVDGAAGVAGRRRHGLRGEDTLRRSVLAEAALGAVVLGVTALLVNAEPGRTATAPAPGPAHHVVDYDTGGPGGQGELAVDIDPAATGPNIIHVTVEDPTSARRDVAELRSELILTARSLGPFPVPLRRTELGVYEATGVQLPYRGAWTLQITVRTSDIDETTVAVPVDVR
ncbi:MAG TPA: copper resistance protein CopC [Pseudonocardiaceae bacterium]|nr:copper resistance protein CopC [Pseudonocardiaceae bacterium]